MRDLQGGLVRLRVVAAFVAGHPTQGMQEQLYVVVTALTRGDAHKGESNRVTRTRCHTARRARPQQGVGQALNDRSNIDLA